MARSDPRGELRWLLGATLVLVPALSALAIALLAPEIDTSRRRVDGDHENGWGFGLMGCAALTGLGLVACARSWWLGRQARRHVEVGELDVTCVIGAWKPGGALRANPGFWTLMSLKGSEVGLRVVADQLVLTGQALHVEVALRHVTALSLRTGMVGVSSRLRLRLADGDTWDLRIQAPPPVARSATALLQAQVARVANLPVPSGCSIQVLESPLAV